MVIVVQITVFEFSEISRKNLLFIRLVFESVLGIALVSFQSMRSGRGSKMLILFCHMLKHPRHVILVCRWILNRPG